MTGTREINEADYKYYNHISGDEIRALIDPGIWETYFKFCVERNPWDRVISLYYFRFPREPRPDFLEFLASGSINVLKRKGLGLYTSNGQVLVNKICKFENLKNDLESVRVIVGIPCSLDLPAAKSGMRPKKRHYREYYDDRSREIVADLFSEEILMHGYCF